MMQTEELSEKFVFKSTLTRLVAQEDFSTLIRRESCKSYVLPTLITFICIRKHVNSLLSVLTK
jgi:hypothetical protein